jgi:hypothetical protein
MRKPKLPPPPLEKVEQAGIIALIRAVGGHVWELSQTREAQQTPGLPDLYATVPAKAGDPRGAISLWIEAKRERGGRVSAAQRHFQKCCQLSGTVHVLGALKEVEAWAEAEGLLTITPTGGWYINRVGRMHLPTVQ